MNDKEILKNECKFCSSDISDISLQSNSIFSEITDSHFKESIPLPKAFPKDRLRLEVFGMTYKISGSATCVIDEDESYIYNIHLERSFKKPIAHGELKEENGMSFVEGSFE